jgi:trk system potassium uptake protein
VARSPASPPHRRRPVFRHPAQVLVGAFAAAVAVGTLLLLLPVSRAGEGGAPLVTALFTATSAVCVTGLVTVDTATYWTPVGQGVILALIQVGGFGIMTMASLIALFLSRRMGLRTRLTAAAETRSLGPGDVRRVLKGVFLITVVVETTVAVVLALRFRAVYDDAWPTAMWHGIFHAVSSFNNAGFSLFSDNLMGFLSDGFVLMPISVAIVIGGLGFPVLTELVRNRRPHTWSLHTRLTLTMTGVLLVGGTAFITLTEWGNPGTLGGLAPLERLLGGWFHAVQPRTAGFNAWDYGAVTDETLLATIMLMFVGGGSAGTAGGLKVTTFIVLFFVIVAEVRGDEDVIAFDRRIDHRVIRQATTVALLGVAAVMGGTMLLTELTDLPFRDVLFETTSAFATVGLSTGITPQVSSPGQVVLVALMFLGRLGPITLVSALALRERNRRYRYPEGAPLIG